MSEQDTKRVTLDDRGPATRTMRDDVLDGLRQSQKKLPSQYLYDERGAVLFEAICETQEYYPTRTEIAILRENMDAIAECIGPGAAVIEPGSGSGIKTELLLDSIEEPAAYVPIDVSKTQLADFAARLTRRIPDLHVAPVCADFTCDFDLPASTKAARRHIVYFPGSTIGNFAPDVAVRILKQMAGLCDDEGGVLLGVDLKKDRETIEPAYDDAAGVSRDFALNYLVRLNRELGADFDLSQFAYEAPYNEREGRIEMALVSLCDQDVSIDGTHVRFRRGERVLTEYSCKYTLAEFEAMAAKAGLGVERVWIDVDGLFSVQYLRPIKDTSGPST